MPRADRMERLGRVFLASIAHLALVAVLAPGLAYATMYLFAVDTTLAQRLAYAPLAGIMAAIFVWPVSVPLAVISIAIYAVARPVRLAPGLVHIVVWAALGAVITSLVARVVGESNALLFLAAGCGLFAGIVIGVLVWVTWRRVDIPLHMVIAD